MKEGHCFIELRFVDEYDPLSVRKTLLKCMDLVSSTILPFIYNTTYSVHGCLMQIYPDSLGFIKIAYDDFFSPQERRIDKEFLANCFHAEFSIFHSASTC